MITVKKSAHLLVLASAFLVAFRIVAQATPSPYIEPLRALPDFHEDITTLTFNEAAPLATKKKPAQSETVGIGASEEERALFDARPDRTNKPAGRCSVRSIVFAKITLASACY